MNKFLLLHEVGSDIEITTRKDFITEIRETAGGSIVSTADRKYVVQESPHTIFAKLQEPDAIITTNGRVYK